MNRENQKEYDLRYYSSMCNAWCLTNLERDKYLIFISSGMIGLLINLLNSIKNVAPYTLCIYVLTFLCFLTCIISSIYLFSQNGRFLEKVVHELSEESRKGIRNNSALVTLHKISFTTFVLGLSFFCLVGVLTYL